MEDDNSYGELIIDESITTDDEEAESHISVDCNRGHRDLYGKKYNMISLKHEEHQISKAPLETMVSEVDLREEFLSDMTYSCNICKEPFKYNIGLIYHMEVDHGQSTMPVITSPSVPLDLRTHGKKIGSAKLLASNLKQKHKQHFKDTQDSLKLLKKLRERGVIDFAKIKTEKPKCSGASGPTNPTSTARPMCATCKKCFSNESKLSEHNKLVLQFKCTFCNLKFCWESKYKKHLYKTHKLEAAVVCKCCFQVFDTMDKLDIHMVKCRKDGSETTIQTVNIHSV